MSRIAARTDVSGLRSPPGDMPLDVRKRVDELLRAILPWFAERADRSPSPGREQLAQTIAAGVLYQLMVIDLRGSEIARIEELVDDFLDGFGKIS